MPEDDTKNFVLQQYRECCEDLRQHDKFIWQIPPIAVAIAGGLGVAAFRYVTEPFASGCLFLFATILTISLLYAIVKHRYFSRIEQKTLCEIERVTGTRKLIQRTTNLQTKDYYWHAETPRSYEKWSGHKVLIAAMFSMSVTLLSLAILEFIEAKLTGKELIFVVVVFPLILIIFFCVEKFMDRRR